MERVVKFVCVESKKWDSEVQNIILERSVLEEEVQIIQMKLHISIPVSKIYYASLIKLIGFWTFTN